MFQKVSMWIQCTTARCFVSWKPTSITSSPIRGMNWFFSYTIMPAYIIPSSWQHSSTSLVCLFFSIRLTRLIWHQVIFGYSCASKISWVARILQMIYRWNKQLQNFSVIVQRVFTLWEFTDLQVNMKNVLTLPVTTLKNGLSHIAFVVLFSQKFEHVALRCVIGIFTFGMILVNIWWELRAIRRKYTEKISRKWWTRLSKTTWREIWGKFKTNLRAKVQKTMSFMYELFVSCENSRVQNS